MFSSSPNHQLTKKSRSEYIKINLTQSEIKVIEHKLTNINIVFKEKNLFLNLPELYRILLLNIDEKEILDILPKIYAEQVSSIFGGKEK